MSKVTLATVKSFLKKNDGNLYFQEHSRFDGMTDCVQSSDSKDFSKLEGKFDPEDKSQCGFNGVWFVRGSRDSFTKVTIVSQSGTYEGYHCYNCCGSWTVAVKVA